MGGKLVKGTTAGTAGAVATGLGAGGAGVCGKAVRVFNWTSSFITEGGMARPTALRADCLIVPLDAMP